MPTSTQTESKLSPGKRASKSASTAAAASAAPRVVSEASSPPPLNLQARQNMIAEAAYYRAEQRAFSPGWELVDWLAAEAEIDPCPRGE
jgi:hypothetical protein